MRAATKQWLLIVFLAASLAAMVALVFWQMAKARREAPSRQDPSRPAPVSRTPLPSPEA